MKHKKTLKTIGNNINPVLDREPNVKEIHRSWLEMCVLPNSTVCPLLVHLSFSLQGLSFADSTSWKLFLQLIFWRLSNILYVYEKRFVNHAKLRDIFIFFFCTTTNILSPSYTTQRVLRILHIQPRKPFHPTYNPRMDRNLFYHHPTGRRIPALSGKSKCARRSVAVADSAVSRCKNREERSPDSRFISTRRTAPTLERCISPRVCVYIRNVDRQSHTYAGFYFPKVRSPVSRNFFCPGSFFCIYKACEKWHCCSSPTFFVST